MPNGNTENLASGNGHSTAAEAIYALSDEQILEIEDSAATEDASVSAPLNHADGIDGSAENTPLHEGHSD